MIVVNVTAAELLSPAELNPALLVSDRIRKILNTTALKCGDPITGVPPLAVQMDAMWTLHGAVHNGGFTLYLDDYRAEGSRQAIAMFETLGLWDHARVVLLALGRCDPAIDGLDRQGHVLENGPFSDLDNEYWGLAGLNGPADAYVRKHATAFEFLVNLDDTSVS